MKFYYIFTFLYVILILALIFATSIEASVTKNFNGKITDHVNLLSQRVKDLNKYEANVRRPQREFLNKILSKDNYDNMAYSDADYNLDSNEDGSEESEKWFQDKLKHSSTQNQQSQELSNLLNYLKQSKQELSLFDGNDDEDGEDNGEHLKEKYFSARGGTSLRNSNGKSNPNNSQGVVEIRKFRILHNNTKNENDDSMNFNLTNSKNQSQQASSDHNLPKAKYSTDSLQIADCINTDLSGCHQCSQPHQQQIGYSRSHNLRNKNFFEKISSTSNEDKNLMNDSFYNKRCKAQPSPHLSKNQKFFGTNISVQPKQIDVENNGNDNLALVKFSVAAREKYNWESQPFNDQLKNTKNTLSHEADYKLSKVEQDNSEKRKDSSWRWNIFKRSHEFNPMHEIELKTSNRLMKKGFGASLPSSLLGVFQPEYQLEFMENNQGVRDEISKDDLMGYNKNFAEYDFKRRKTINKENERYRREKKSNDKKNISVRNRCSDGNEALKTLESKNEENNRKNFSNLKALEDIETGKVDLKDFDFKTSEPGSNLYVKTQQKPDQLNKENFELANIQEPQKALITSQEENKMEDNLNALKESRNNVSKFRRKRSISSEADLTYKALNDSDLNYRKYNNFDIKRVCKDKDKLQKSPKQLREKNFETNDFQEPSEAFEISTERNKMSDKESSYTGRSDYLSLKLLQRRKRSFNMSDIKFKYAKITKFPDEFKSSKLGIRLKSFLNLSEDSTDYPLTSQGNSLTKENDLKVFTKICLKEILKVPKHIKAFLKKTLKFLRFGAIDINMNQTNIREDEKLKILQSKTKIPLTVSNDIRTNITANKTNLGKGFNKSFSEYDENFNYNYKIHPKLRLFKEGLHNLFNYSKFLKSSYNLKYNDNVKRRSERAAEILHKFENKYNKKQNFVESKSFNKKRYQVKENTKSLRIVNESETINKQIKKSNCNENIKEAPGDKFNKKKLRLNGSLAKNGSSVENLKTKFSNNDYNKNNLKSKGKLAPKFVSKQRKRSLAKRSLDTFYLNNDIQADTVKRPIRKRFLSYFKDLNRPKPNLYYPSDEQYKSDFALYSNDDQLKKLGLEYKKPHKKLKKEIDNLKMPEASKFCNPINRIKNSISKPNKQNQIIRQQNRYESPQKFAKSFERISKMKSKDLLKMKPVSTLETNMLQDLGYTNNPLMVGTLKSQYLNDLKDFNQNYKFNENPVDMSMPYLRSSPDNKNNTIDETDDSQQLNLALRNEILNCQAFESLQDFLKSLPQNITHPFLTNTTSSGQIHMVVSAVNGTQTTISSIIEPSMSLDYTTTEESNNKTSDVYYETSTYAYLELTEEPKDYTTQFSVDNCEVPTNTKTVTDSEDEYLLENTTEAKEVKLNISIKAKVQGNPLDKNFYGNGTIHVIPGLTDDRIRRNIFLHPLDELQKEIYDEMSTIRPHYIEDSEDINILASGKFSDDIVQTIFNTVQTDPTLKFLWPSLKSSEKEGKSTNPNFYAIRNQDNEEEIHHVENLFIEAMDAINSIIEEQARSHTCMPLRPDLQEFYNLILESRREQDLMRAKRNMSNKIKSNIFNQDVRQGDFNEIEEDNKIVKNLLKEYESLPEQDRKQVTTITDELLKNLILLRQLIKN